MLVMLITLGAHILPSNVTLQYKKLHSLGTVADSRTPGLHLLYLYCGKVKERGSSAVQSTARHFLRPVTEGWLHGRLMR